MYLDNLNWLQDRVNISFKNLGANCWDFSDSLLMYSAAGQESYVETSKVATDYYNFVTKAELEHLNIGIEKLSEVLPTKFNFIDLGPGAEKKELLFFKAFTKHKKKFKYFPVDVSEVFLNGAIESARSLGIKCQPLNIPFESVTKSFVNEDKIPNLVSLIGLTYGNYDSAVILNLLTEIAGTNSYVYFDMQLLDRIDISTLENIYKVNTRFACYEKLKLLGLNSVNIDQELITDGCIEIKYRVTKPSDYLISRDVCIGDEICLFKSLRKTKVELENDLKKYKYTVFDTKHSIISGVIFT